MIRVALLFLDLCRPLFRWMNVPFEQVRAIVGVKLLLDTRRTGALTSLNQSETSSSTIFAYIFYAIMGALTGFLLAIVPSSIVGYALHYSFLMFFIALILISDYSSVILDTSDNTIILPRPVSSRTLLVARITHIVLYIGQLFLCLAAIPLVVSFVVHGWMAGVANIIASLLSVLLAFAATGGLYLLLIRFFKEERLKSVINVVQIFTTVFLLTSYQILPRLFDAADVENMLDYLPVWSLVVPPLWMAGSVTVFVDQPLTALVAACMVLALATPFVLIWLSTTYLAPYFATRLADLGTSTTSAAPPLATERKTWFEGLTNKITAPGIERAAFQLVGRYFSRDRKLKLRIYPSIGYLAVMAVVFMLRSKDNSQSWSEFFLQLPQTNDYIIALYLVIFIVFGAAFEIFYSDEFKGAWVFYSTPVGVPGKILMGTFKAILVRFFLPFYALTSLVIFLVWQWRAVPAIVVALLMSVLVVLVVLLANEKNLPMSLQPSLRNQGSNMARGIMALILIAGLGYAHFLLVMLGHWQWVAVPVLLGVIFFLGGRYAGTTWARIRQ